MDFDLSKGAAPINRCILTDPIIYDPVQFHLFMYLLIKANHSDNEIIKGGKRILIRRGSTLSGRDLLSEHLQIKPSTVNTRLKNLEKTGYIQINSFNKYSIISINNYEQFTFLGLQSNNKTTIDKQQNSTINNDHNEENEHNVKKKN
jgi:DNA-binding transcriptional regulator YhcF (GntR family)